MNPKAFYSIMALSAVPGAAMQAAVNVPVTQEAQIAALDGDVYKVNVNFETLVPGTYKLTAMVTDGNVNQA